MDFQMTSEANFAKPGSHKQLSDLMKKDPIRKEAKTVDEVREIIDRLWNNRKHHFESNYISVWIIILEYVLTISQK